MLLLAGPATNGVVFAISARPVSQAQFRAFCQRTSRPYPRQPWSEDDDPVVNVTWNEARDYLVWLSSTTGKRYRLATETEWLYFVGQGKVDARWRNGNVREWLQDTASDPISDPEESTADTVDVANTTPGATPGAEHHRVVRGVSYADTATDLLSARRTRDASMRDALTGFRALREIH
jgi:formylglycine-generating enzyme required for sulfatase activity